MRGPALCSNAASAAMMLHFSVVQLSGEISAFSRGGWARGGSRQSLGNFVFCWKRTAFHTFGGAAVARIDSLAKTNKAKYALFHKVSSVGHNNSVIVMDFTKTFSQVCFQSQPLLASSHYSVKKGTSGEHVIAHDVTSTSLMKLYSSPSSSRRDLFDPHLRRERNREI